ncbi:RidA family protein [Hymenobacter terrenus]|uniref:RidA family protein n=1 Tax=Hymenobacter terrenus TaxID=1629124 RepID=UPI0009E564C9|nr:RidA family protein [Hymenobacter terrenus]
MKKAITAALAAGLAHTAHAQAPTSAVLTQEKNTFVNPAGLFDPRHNGFSHLAKVPAGTELVYVAGQWASDATGKLVASDFETQVRQTLRNLKAALAAAGLSTRHVVKQTVYIAEFSPEKKAALIKVAGAEWGAEVFPAGTIVPVPMLATAPGCLIEVEVIASK